MHTFRSILYDIIALHDSLSLTLTDQLKLFGDFFTDVLYCAVERKIHTNLREKKYMLLENLKFEIEDGSFGGNFVFALIHFICG